MGLIDSLKGVYYFFEDKWYNTLDKIDPKIPVYKIIDPIDRVIPSFVLFLLLALFVLVFLLYFIKFNSPYDITFSLSDSTTKKVLSGVALAGTINEEVFSTTTDSTGTATITITSIKKNVIESLSSIFFDDKIYLEGVISASKEEYKPIVKKEIELEKENKLFLEKLPVQIDLSYPDSYTVRLVDDSTNEVIVDSTNSSYVKFKCDNKTNSPKKVTDIQDAEVDGIFKLNDSSCAFVITEAFAPGYEALGSQITLPLTNGVYDIHLRQVVTQNQGTARVNVTKSGSVAGLSNIKVEFHKSGVDAYSITDNSGVAEKVLESGTYVITISDANYLPITPDANKTITITNGQTSTLSIVLIELPEQDRRIIYFKVLDSIDNNEIRNVTVDLITTTVDENGTYVGVKNDDTIFYSGSSGTTDSNGLFLRTGLSKYDGNIIAVLKKDGYVYKIFKPTLKMVSDTFETTYIVKSNESNSGKAIVNVKSNAGKILQNSSTYLYLNGVTDSIRVKNIKLNRNALLTNSSGTSNFSELASDYNYSASAWFDGSFSGVSNSKLLDANKTITFDLNININASYLKISLIDAGTLAEITTSADVNLYSVSEPNSSTTLLEKLISTTNSYTSKAYPKSSKLAIKVNLAGYVPNIVYVDGLTAGENIYKIKLYSLSMLDSDANVSVFFDDVFGPNDTPLSGVSTLNTITSGGTFRAKFDILTNAPLDFNKILGMVRVKGPIRVTNTLPNSLDSYRKEQNSFSCNTESQDNLSGVHDDNYYFPTNCTDGNKIQGGFRWGDSNIPLGTYSYVITFTIDANSTDQNIFLNYRAKETNNTSVSKKSETKLKSVRFVIDVPFRSGIYFILKQSGTSFSVPSSSVSSTKLTLTPQEENSFSLQLANQTTKSLTGGKITIYSYAGSSIDYSGAGYSNPIGSVYFDASHTLSQKDIITSLSINPNYRSPFYNVLAYPIKFNSTEWIVLVAEFSNDSNKYVAFINTKSFGKNLVLRAEFLAGAPDQLFEGEVSDITGSATPVIRSARVEVYKNCNNASKSLVYDFSLTSSSELNGSYFNKVIPGVYEYGIDCVYVSVNADDGTENIYNPINRQKIIAGSGGAIDPALACVNIKINNASLTSSLEEDLLFNWNSEEKVTISNNCAKAVTVNLDTGLVCNTATSSFVKNNEDCSIEKNIAVGEKQNYIITGKNVDFVSDALAPNFTDVLGYYALNVRAKFSSESNKKFAIAARAHVHLSNPNQCFAISKDYFDFTQNDEQKIDFNFINDCQYALIGDYFIPKVALNTFGYDINTTKPNIESVSFTPIAKITGNTFVTNEYPVSLDTWGSVASATNLSANKKAIPGDNTLSRYENVHIVPVDTNGTVSQLQIRFFDINNAKQGINQLYGAKIDGDIVINYQDGNVVRIVPRVNFAIDENGVHCIGSPTSSEYCEVGPEGTDFIFGLIYVNLTPKEHISSIDMNWIANNDPTNLELQARPHLQLTLTETRTTLSSTSSTSSINLTTSPITIPALEGVVFIVGDVSSLTNLSQTAYTTISNPIIYLQSSNANVVTWIEGGSLKAQFVGTDYSGFNNRNIPASITKTFGQSISYGTTTVIDYVSKDTAGGKTISGIN